MPIVIDHITIAAATTEVSMELMARLLGVSAGPVAKRWSGSPMRRPFLLFSVASASISACADPVFPRAEEQIAALEHRVEEATRLGQVAFLDSVYAPTFRFKHGTGELEERAERLAALSQGTTRVWARELDSLDVEVHEDVALTTGRIHVRQEDEEPQWRDYTVRYARIYVRRNGRWQLLTHHTTGLTFGPLNP